VNYEEIDKQCDKFLRKMSDLVSDEKIEPLVLMQALINLISNIALDTSIENNEPIEDLINAVVKDIKECVRLKLEYKKVH
jgi:hypothetical protein